LRLCGKILLDLIENSQQLNKFISRKGAKFAEKLKTINKKFLLLIHIIDELLI